MIVIPLNNDPIEEFIFDLEGLAYRFVKRWVEIAGGWTLDMFGQVNEVELTGMPLVTNSDILGPHAILEMGRMVLIDLNNQNEDPDFDNFGTRFQLFYFPKGTF